jgi:hypothetical protein
MLEAGLILKARFSGPVQRGAAHETPAIEGKNPCPAPLPAAWSEEIG